MLFTRMFNNFLAVNSLRFLQNYNFSMRASQISFGV